jgi:hypothetical protein
MTRRRLEPADDFSDPLGVVHRHVWPDRQAENLLVHGLADRVRASAEP